MAPGSPVEQESEARARSPLGQLGIALLVLVATVALSIWRYGAPSPLPEEAPAERFSAGRAMKVLRHVLAENTPHPTGSTQNGVVRRRIVASLRDLGYSPEIHTALACGGLHRYGACSAVQNVLAQLPGPNQRPAVLLIAHYDSAMAAPGAADDGFGIAVILEVARALIQEGPLARPVIFLLTDAEETGLIGARAFVNDHPSARQLFAAVNLEARGTTGPSLMFETSAHNAALIRTFAGAVSRPVSSSVFSYVYRATPNDTDFSVLARSGVAGFNLANIRDVAHYHTPLDNLQNASAATLQHHGDNALALVRALAALPAARAAADEDAVYFDFLAWTVVRWPESWSLPLAIAPLFLLSLVLLRDDRRSQARRAAWGLLAWVAVPFGSAALGFVLGWLLERGGALPSFWVAHPLPALLCLMAPGVALAMLVAAWAGRRTTRQGLWIGCWIGVALAGIAMAATLPAFSYLLIPPAWLGALLVFVTARRPSAHDRQGLASIGAMAGASLIWVPLLWILYDAIGFSVPALYTLGAGLVVSTLAPLLASLRARFPRGRAPLGLAALAVAAGAIALVVPAHDEQTPARVNISLHQQLDRDEAHWRISAILSPIPAALRALPGFGPREPFAWIRFREQTIAAPTEPASLAGAELVVTRSNSQDGSRTLRARLLTRRASSVAAVAIPLSARLQSVVHAGRKYAPFHPQPAGGYHLYRFAKLPREGIELELRIEGSQPVEVVVMEWSAGFSYEDLAARARPLLEARPSAAVPSHLGDGILTTRRQSL